MTGFLFSYLMPIPGHRNGSLAHWFWCLPLLLIVAFLSLRQIDLYPPEPDEFYSMYNAGWLANGPYSPIEVLQSLYNTSPQHTPGYFILLSVWGNLTSFDLATGRVLSVYFGLLSLCVLFRLAAHFAAPAAGLFAIIILSSNSFGNYYLAIVRMYPLLVFLSGLVLWMYLRIVQWRRDVKRIDYFAFGIAIFLTLNVHASSMAFLLVLAIYHVCFVSRDRRWKLLALAVVAAVALSAPWYSIVATRGISQSARDWEALATGAWDTIATWLKLVTNGQPLLLFISCGGLALAFFEKKFQFKSIAMLVGIHLVLLGLLSDATKYVLVSTMRYQLPASFIFSLLMACGLYSLYRYRRWLGFALILWLAAGFSFQASADWKRYIAGQSTVFLAPPWQVVARMAADAEVKPRVVAYRISNLVLDFSWRLNYSQRQYYFDGSDVHINFVNDPHHLKIMAQKFAIVAPRVWVNYQRTDANPSEIEDVAEAMASLHYDHCDTIGVGAETTILDFSWRELNCNEFHLKLQSQSDLIDHEFFGAWLNASAPILTFADAWKENLDYASEDLAMSYQLLSPDWDNVAQLDLPLVHEGVPRRFSIDVSDVEPGRYRLMAILYDRTTGERIDWLENEGTSPDMLALAEVDLR